VQVVLKEVAQNHDATLSHRLEAYSLPIESTNDPHYKTVHATIIKQAEHKESVGK